LPIGPVTIADSGTASGTVPSIVAPEHDMAIMAEITSGVTAIMDGHLDTAGSTGGGTETDTGKGIGKDTVHTVSHATHIRAEDILTSDERLASAVSKPLQRAKSTSPFGQSVWKGGMVYSRMATSIAPRLGLD